MKSQRLRHLLGGVSVLTGLAVVYLAVCWFVVQALISPLRVSLEQSPAELGFPQAVEVSLNSANDGLQLQGWFVPSWGQRAVIMVHGIHAHAWHGSAPDLVRAFIEGGFDVLLFDLRGHGKSAGETVGLGIRELGDLRAAVDYLLERGFAPGRIGVYGTSYGGAISLVAMPHLPEVGVLIADSAFADVREAVGSELERQTSLPAEIISILWPGMRLAGSWSYDLDIEAASPLKSIHAIAPRPVLLVHGELDAVIPVDHARQLKAQGGPKTDLMLLPGGHTEGVRLEPDFRAFSPTRSIYLSRVIRFFDERLPASLPTE